MLNGSCRARQPACFPCIKHLLGPGAILERFVVAGGAELGEFMGAERMGVVVSGYSNIILEYFRDPYHMVQDLR